MAVSDHEKRPMETSEEASKQVRSQPAWWNAIRREYGMSLERGEEHGCVKTCEIRWNLTRIQECDFLQVTENPY